MKIKDDKHFFPLHTCIRVDIFGRTHTFNNSVRAYNEMFTIFKAVLLLRKTPLYELDNRITVSVEYVQLTVWLDNMTKTLSETLLHSEGR